MALYGSARVLYCTTRREQRFSSTSTSSLVFASPCILGLDELASTSLSARTVERLRVFFFCRRTQRRFSVEQANLWRSHRGSSFKGLSRLLSHRLASTDNTWPSIARPRRTRRTATDVTSPYGAPSLILVFRMSSSTPSTTKRFLVVYVWHSRVFRLCLLPPFCRGCTFLHRQQIEVYT